jgi:hypothetical protein
MSIGGRRGVVATVAAVMITTATAACGSQQDSTVEDAVRAPAAMPTVPFHTSPDIIERRSGEGQDSPSSADAAERRGQPGHVPYAGKRVPD